MAHTQTHTQLDVFIKLQHDFLIPPFYSIFFVYLGVFIITKVFLCCAPMNVNHITLDVNEHLTPEAQPKIAFKKRCDIFCSADFVGIIWRDTPIFVLSIVNSYVMIIVYLIL